MNSMMHETFYEVWSIIANDEKRQFEFTPKVAGFTSCTVSYDECINIEEACFVVWKNNTAKNRKQMNKELTNQETLEKILEEIEASNPNLVPEWKAIWRDGAKKATRVFTKYLDQEKKKEAIAFGEFLKKNYITGITIGTRDAVWLSIHVNDENEYKEEQLYELFNQQKMKKLLQQKAESLYPVNPNCHEETKTIHFISKQRQIDAFLAGAKEILDNPELYLNCGGVWVNAGDRMPNAGGIYFVKCYHKDYPNEVQKASVQINSDGTYFFPNENFRIKEWLCESNEKG